MDKVWFEDELLPSQEAIHFITKELSKSDIQRSDQIERDVKSEAKGIVRINVPDWGLLKEDPNLLNSGTNCKFIIVRLGFQFDFPEEQREKGAQYIFARCQAFIWSDNAEKHQPRVYEVIPKDVYEGEPHKMTVKLGPEFKVGDTGGSVGEISTELLTGRITPAVVGWAGDEERTPYWDLRPITKILVGTQNVWMVVQVPDPCEVIRVAPLVEADIQTKWGPIAIGPKERILKNRKSIGISLR